jgi:hypothetical protein
MASTGDARQGLDVKATAYLGDREQVLARREMF